MTARYHYYMASGLISHVIGPTCSHNQNLRARTLVSVARRDVTVNSIGVSVTKSAEKAGLLLRNNHIRPSELRDADVEAYIESSGVSSDSLKFVLHFPGHHLNKV